MSSILFEQQGLLANIKLNRPQKCNAINQDMMEALKEHLHQIKNNPKIQVLILSGEGRHFCAGADLHWMTSADLPLEKSNKHTQLFSEVLHTLYTLPKPVITSVQGKTLGGGLGLLACSDIVIAEKSALFCFTEAKLGLIPALIAPYVFNAVSPRIAKAHMLTANLINAKEAKKINLITHICEKNTLKENTTLLAETLLSHSHQSLLMIKTLNFHTQAINKEMIATANHLLAQIRSSQEAKIRIKAFLDKI